jgi:hypothetical protein
MKDIKSSITQNKNIHFYDYILIYYFVIDECFKRTGQIKLIDLNFKLRTVNCNSLTTTYTVFCLILFKKTVN